MDFIADYFHSLNKAIDRSDYLKVCILCIIPVLIICVLVSLIIRVVGALIGIFFPFILIAVVLYMYSYYSKN